MKFSIGEVCDVRSTIGYFLGWREGTITAVPLGKDESYGIYIPTFLSERITKDWKVKEFDLRKKRPPQDMSEFTFDELINDLNKVSA